MTYNVAYSIFFLSLHLRGCCPDDRPFCWNGGWRLASFWASLRESFLKQDHSVPSVHHLIGWWLFLGGCGVDVWRVSRGVRNPGYFVIRVQVLDMLPGQRPASAFPEHEQVHFVGTPKLHRLAWASVAAIPKRISCQKIHNHN